MAQQADKSWKIRITAENEPGIPMIVAGKVVDEHGAAIPGVKVYVYHTDADGLYQKKGPDGRSLGGFRLNGTMWTNAEGKFEFRTIRPAPYPGSKSGEHFHFKLTEGGIPDHFANIEFYDDRPRNKLVVSIGKQGESSRYDTSFAWKEDTWKEGAKETKGQRLEVVFRVIR